MGLKLLVAQQARPFNRARSNGFTTTFFVEKYFMFILYACYHFIHKIEFDVQSVGPTTILKVLGTRSHNLSP